MYIDIGQKIEFLVKCSAASSVEALRCEIMLINIVDSFSMLVGR